MADIDIRNERLEDCVNIAEQIKAKVKDVAENKDITVVNDVDTPLTVLTKIDSGTIKTPSDTIPITQNGTVDVTNYARASVNVQPTLQNKQVTITTNTITTITKDAGYDGLNEIEVITNVVENLDTELNTQDSLLNNLETSINNLSGLGSIIRTAEMPDVTITLSQGGTDIESKATPASTGGIVDFTVTSIGTYTLTATGTNITTWTRNIEITELNTIVECKAGILSNYTYAQWHTALQGGYFSIMFSLRDTFIYSQSENILHNYKFFVEKITQVGDKEIVDFRMAGQYAGGSYNINPMVGYITNAGDSSWTVGRYSYGGYKYSAMRQRMMEQGDEVYSQATGILPDDYTGSLTTGIKFSDLKYSDTGLTCPIYSYSSSADTMTLLSSASLTTPNNTAMMFIKGYFKSVGQIDEATFNNGVYYIATAVSNATIYTKETTWVSGTTYYGLYEILQEDGIFAGALKTSNFASYLAKFNDNASAGGTQTSMVSSFSDYADIPAVEEITGINRTTTLMSGASAQNITSNLANEGTKKPSYDFSVQATANVYWTRSASSSYNYGFYCIYVSGNLGIYYANDSSNGVRLGFRLQ